jgi:transcriptional regulator with XRE-family HTH domain
MSTRGLSKVPTREQKYVKSEIAKISSKLQVRRQELGLTQEQLAEQLDVSTETVRFIEQMRRIPSLPMLIRLAKILKLDVLD